MIYKRLIRFLLEKRLFEIYFSDENQADEFFEWLYPKNQRKEILL